MEKIKKNSSIKKIMTLLLVFMMVFTMMPATALADTGTNPNVGPGKYKVGTADRSLSNWKNAPLYSVGKGQRRGLYNKYWQKNETYYMYSSVGEQIMTKKRTEPRPKEGRSTRAIEQKRGVFRSMMERQPMRVSIPMPKF